MHYQTTRKLARGGHIVIALVQLAYIYTPLHDLPYALLVVQCVTTPLLVMSGVWITRGQKIWQWKGRLQKKMQRQGRKMLRRMRKSSRTVRGAASYDQPVRTPSSLHQ